MSPRRLLFQSLLYHRGVNLAVALGVAVGAAVLSGALIVGDSVRGSLRDLTLDRLGEIDHAMVADRYVREALAEELPATAPVILIRASAESPETGARASKVNLHGTGEAFWTMFNQAAPELGPRDVAVNEALAREVGAKEGDALLLRFQTDTLVPSESVMGRKTDNVRTMRLTVKTVLPNEGPGRFGLSSSQQLPLNAFLPLPALQRALEQEGRVNALLSAEEPDLASAVQLEDLELDVVLLGGQGLLSAQTRRIVLESAAAESVLATAEETGLQATPILTYLANSIEVGDRAVPYSTVTAFSPVPDSLRLVGGQSAPELTGDQILLNEWAARDLNAQPGDPVTLGYYQVGPRGELVTEQRVFELAGIVAMEGVALDRNLAPDFEGMSDVDRMSDWDPPFPVDLSLIRDQDEDYWDRYRTAPKAFVALETAKDLWTNRFGQLTAVRLAPPPGEALDDARERFVVALRDDADPARFGLAFQPVKAQGLEASSGATDFSGLFIGFSLFLIASAAMLVTLLFRLGVERRSREVGLLLASGHPVSRVRRLLLQEGALLALAGCLAGIPGAVAYGWLMVYGLRTWWSAAVGGSFLNLHVTPTSLAAGVVGSLFLMLFAVWMAVRKLGRLTPRALLAGQLEADRNAPSSKLPARLAWGSALGAFALLAVSFTVDTATQAALFFGVGALLLIAALAAFRANLLKPATDSLVGGSSPLWRLGSRNSARFPSRSTLSAALIAGAAFVIVVVALMRHDVSSQEPKLESGDGGFRFAAQSDLPLYPEQLEESSDLFDGRLFALRAKLGEDASCLNLYRPSQPTLLGAGPDLIARGGFAFQSTIAETDAERGNPWLILDRDFPDGAVPVFGDMNSVMWILHLGLGDTLDVEDSLGRRRKLVIAGLMSRSIFQSELLMADGRFLELFPDHSGFQQLLVETDDAEAGVALENRWSDLGLDAETSADRLAGFLVVENTYLSTFQTLGGLGLLLGTFGLAVVMVRNVLERRRELALLQAVGFAKQSVSRVVLAENAYLLVFGLLAGTAAALLATAPHLLSGLAEPPWASLLMTLAVILVCGLLAGAAAVRVSLGQPLLPSLRRD